jgi:NAD(P)-dependent dehydrogenase (short-subunit alcohol dehydrogenase family)
MYNMKQELLAVEEPIMDTGLKDTHVLVTGASGGIGLVLTRILLEEKARVTAMFSSQREGLDKLSETWENTLHVVQGDVSEEKDVETLFSNANDTFGRVDGVVTNAGVSEPHGIAVQEMSLEQWNRTIRINLTGTFLCVKYFFRNLEQNPGTSASLVLVGSTAGEFGEAWYSDYSTSKAGLTGLLLTLKNEIVHLAPRGRVNLVNPGWTLTPMAEGRLEDKESVARIFQTLPMRKVAIPEDVASVMVYLLSDKLAGHVSGQTITVAGGMEGRVLFTPEETQLE